MQDVKTTFEDSGDFYKVRMNGVLQLSIPKEEFLGVYCYANGLKKKYYYIDINYKTTVVTTKYFTKELWIEVAKILDENIV